MSKINENGFWEGKEASGQHCYDKKLSLALVNFFLGEKVEKVVDFGCGMGNYVEHFIENNIEAIGYDGNPHTPELTNNICKVLDLSKPVEFDKPFCWVMSLEVGEHLPKKFEDIFINNLHNNNNEGIILSWAIKGQGGYGHFNERNNDYIKSRVCSLGYINDIETENELRQNVSNAWWFKKSIMVFRKFKKNFPPIFFDSKKIFNHSWFSNNNQIIFNKIISEYNVNNICELGSWFGTSSKYFSSKINGKLYCIDLWNNDFIIQKDDNEYIDDQYSDKDKKLLENRDLYTTFLNNLYEFKDKVIPIRTDTISGIKLLESQNIKIDLFYIDANHTYDSVKKEILLIKEKYPNSLIFGDDYHFIGVKKAVNELSHKYNDIELIIKPPCWFYKPVKK